MDLNNILNALEAEEQHDDSVICVIDDNMRIITVPSTGLVFGVEHDKDVNKVTFEMDRYYRDNDMSEFIARVVYQNANGDKNYTAVTDLTFTEDKITFSWIVPAYALLYEGNLIFAVTFLKTVDGTIAKALNTTTTTAKCLSGLQVDELIPEEELKDYIETIKSDIKAFSDKELSSIKIASEDSIANINSVAKSKVADINDAANKKIDEINSVDFYKKADERYAPIESALTISGNGVGPIRLAPTVKWLFKSIKVYGKSTQTSMQLLKLTEPTYSAGGMTAILQDDGSLLVNGTPSSAPANLIYMPLELDNGTYYISGGEESPGCAIAFIARTTSSGTYYFANQSFPIDGTETSLVFMIQSKYQDPITDYRIAAMLNKGSDPFPLQNNVPTPDSLIPIINAGNDGHIELIFTGENICPISSGKTNFSTNLVVKKGVTYTLCGIAVPDEESNRNFDIVIFDDSNLSQPVQTIVIDENINQSWKNGYVVFTPEKTGYLYINSYASLNWTELSIYFGELNSRKFVPYETSSIMLSTPTGLSGIPLEIGGNYVDAEKKQQICDIIDLSKKEKNTVLGHYEFTGNETFSDFGLSTDGYYRWSYTVDDMYADNGDHSLLKAVMCNYFKSAPLNSSSKNMIACGQQNNIIFTTSMTLENLKLFMNEKNENGKPVEIIYRLNTPTITPLSEEEITSYRSATSFDNITVADVIQTVAGIEVTAIADSNTIIKKLEEKINSIGAIALGGNL